MGTKKMQKSLDSVKSDLRELKEAFWHLRDEVVTHQAVSAAEQQSRTSSKDQRRPASREGSGTAEESIGNLTTLGSYDMPNGADIRGVYRWALEEQPVEDLFSIQIDESARMLAAIGHKQRLRILLRLLRQPATASDLVADLALGTTGAAYHHLNVLQSAGLVEQEHRGVFSIVPDRVPMLMSILAGFSDGFQMTVEHVHTDAEPDGEMVETVS